LFLEPRGGRFGDLELYGTACSLQRPTIAFFNGTVQVERDSMLLLVNDRKGLAWASFYL
jgi:hypothetical protein